MGTIDDIVADVGEILVGTKKLNEISGVMEIIRFITEENLKPNDEQIERIRGKILASKKYYLNHSEVDDDMITQILKEELSGVSVETLDIEAIINQMEVLEYYHTTTAGLWATDHPEVIPKAWREMYFWQ